MISRKFKFLLLLLLGAGSLSAKAEEKAFSPILPLRTGKLETIPLLELVLRDARQDLKLTSVEEVKDADEKAKDIDVDYASETSEKAQKAFEAMRLNIALAYYLEDLQLGVTKDKNPLTIKLPELRARIVKYATDLVSIGSNPAIKERAAYHLRAQNFLLGKIAAPTVVAKSSKKPTPDGPYRQQLEFLDTLAAISDGVQSEAAIAKMIKLSSTMEGYGYFASAIAAARALAGIDASGKKTGTTKQNYKTYLQKATLLVEKYPEPLKERVIGFSIALWVMAEEDGVNWMQPPLSLQSFDGMSDLDAIHERRAYAMFNARQRMGAIDLFTKILTEYETSPELGRLTDRYLELHYLNGKATKNFDAYMQALHRVNTAFKSNDVLGDDGEKLVDKFRKKFHMQFYIAVLSGFKDARDPKASDAVKVAAQRHGLLFLPWAQDPKEKERVLGELGSLFLASRSYAKAVDYYQQAEKISHKPGYLAKAIEAQQSIAQWPPQPPWDKEPTGDRAARRKLITFYQMILKDKPSNWFALAHVGLLQKITGSMDAAVKTWMPQLSKDPQNPHAERAAGIMVQYFQEKKKWPELVGLLQLAAKNKIEPKQRGKPIDAQKALGDALYTAGNQHALRRDHKSTLRFLRVFSSQFKEDPRLPEVIFKSGMAYQGLKEESKFILAMKAVNRSSPKTKWGQEAVRKGMELAKDESHKIYFCEAFLKNYPQNPDSAAVRDKLSKMYVALTMYPKAIALFQAKEKDPRTPAAAKVSANMSIIELSEKANLPNPGLAAAQRIMKLPNAPQDVLAKSYALFAKHHAQQKQFDMVEHFDKLSSKLTARDKVSAESIAQIRYLMALHNAAKPYHHPDPRTVKNPNAEVQNQIVFFQSIKTPFDRVCQLGATNSCKLARKSLSEYAQRSYDAVNAIEMAQAPDNKTLQAFGVRKKQVLQAISVSIRKDTGMAH